MISIILRLVNIVLITYCLLSFLAPTSQFMFMLKKVVDPVLNPIRNFLYKTFPDLKNLAIDISPIVLFLLISLIRNLF